MTATRRLLYMLYALTVLQLWSCGADEVVGNDEQPQSEVRMTFDVSAEQSLTRADGTNGGEAISGTTLPTDKTFKLWGWMVEGANAYPLKSDFNPHPLTGVTVSYKEGTGWTTDEEFYWPRPKFRADFFAIYPADTETSFSATTKTITYTEYKGDVDLMYATFSDQRPVRDNAEKSRTVYIRFHHAMAQLLFFAKLSEEAKALGWTIEVKEIKICNMNGGGTFSLTDAYTNLGANYGLGNSQGIGSASAMSFAPQTPSTKTTYTPTMGAETVTVNSTEEAVPLSSPTDVLMILPQKLSSWNISTETTGTTQPVTEGGYISVSLRAIKSTDSGNTYPLKTNGDFITVYAPFTSPTASGFEGDNIYKYTLTLGSSVTMTAAITEWSTESITPAAPLYPNK